jgi:isocitrate/isopropylmalate dehydrogenase
MMLRHSLADERAAMQIERAVDRVYADGLRTAELCATSSAALGTAAFTEAVISRL